MGYIFEKEYDVRYYEVDFKGQLLLSRMLNYFDDCAVIQSQNLGIGVGYLFSINATWFLYQWNIEIKKLPSFGEKVKVITEPLDFYRFYATRRFELTGENSTIMARALSLWIFLDLEKKFPKRIPQDLMEKYGCSSDEKLSPWEIKDPQKENYTLEFLTLPVNLDTNFHINQATYVDWVLSSLPMEFLSDYKPVNFKSIYKKEAKSLEKIKVITELNSQHLSIHKIISISSGSELCNMEIEWV